MNNCISLKVKLNRTLYCKKQKKIISISECSSCKYKEYNIKHYNGIKQRTSKQNKREKNRFSIIYNDMNKCCVPGCSTPFYQVEKNEVFEGAFRNRSIKYGAICPFCKNHHEQFHHDTLFNLEYKLLFQHEYIKIYSLEWFIDTFGQDYEFKLSKRKKN